MEAAVVIGLCGGLRGEEVLLSSPKGVIKFWEETRLRKGQPHIMVNIQGRFKGETGGKWHMVPLVDYTNLCIKVRRWVGIWL